MIAKIKLRQLVMALGKMHREACRVKRLLKQRA